MSDLLKMNLALENDQLRRRVHAAVIQTANEQKFMGGASSGFAALVLSDLRRQWDDFILGVAADKDVQSAIVISDDNSFILARNVEDSQIIAIVNGLWGPTAEKISPVGEAE